MKVLFSADYHIKLGQKNVPAEWAANRFRSMFKQMHELEKRADIHIVGGDIFDKLPSMEELELFFEFVSNCSIPTFIYDGNHEATKKGRTFLSNLKNVVAKLNPKVQIVDDYWSDELEGIDIIPYCKLKEFNPDNFAGKILCTHVRGEIPPHVKPEVDLKLFDRWQVVLAGDLHSYDNCQRNILYPGSPVTTSFHRTLVDTGVILLETDSLEHTWIKLDVPQLLKKTVNAGEEMVAGDYHHVMYEVEGNLEELGKVTDTTLIDKKVVKRSTDTALILNPEMTVMEELKEYLLYILEIPEPEVEKIIGEFNNAK